MVECSGLQLDHQRQHERWDLGLEPLAAPRPVLGVTGVDTELMGPGLLQMDGLLLKGAELRAGFSVHPKLPQQLVDRLETALESLRSERISIVHMFDHAYFARAFLDGGWVMRSPHGLNGPGREWIVGRWALG